MDETLVFFTPMAGSTTLAEEGSKQVFVAATEQKKGLTVCLTVKASGHYLPGALATVALVMINCIRREDLQESDPFDDAGYCRPRFWLFVSYLVSFASVVAAVWVLIACFTSNPELSAEERWPGAPIRGRSRLRRLWRLLKQQAGGRGGQAGAGHAQARGLGAFSTAGERLRPLRFVPSTPVHMGEAGIERGSALLTKRKRHPLAKVKGGWTPEEDELLRRLVQEVGEGHWSPIARQLNLATGKDDSCGRIGKQCRERWNHHLRPGICKTAWSVAEEEALVKAHRLLGNRWSGEGQGHGQGQGLGQGQQGQVDCCAGQA
ncbi:hypothetical protein QJQ45_018514 [Haematococcus lacustris]|nr:hypothetical protein QJQ45_018514 [Haematococcus lacustris]